MLRIHGDRDSLLAALTAHWADQQLQIPQALRPAVAPMRRLRTAGIAVVESKAFLEAQRGRVLPGKRWGER